MSKIKIIFIIIVVIVTVGLTTFASNVGLFTELYDAAVDSADGDVAIAYFYNNGFIVKVFDCQGIELFSDFLYANGGGSIYLEYIDSYLYIYIGRSDTFLIYDANLNYISDIDSPDLYASYKLSFERANWRNWTDSKSSKIYILGDTEYRYIASSFWENIAGKGWCEFCICDSNGNTTVIYNSCS